MDEKKQLTLMRFFSTILCCLWLPVSAGNFNVVHLSDDPELTIEVSCDKRTQSFALKPGDNSGTFTLPEKPAIFRVKDQELKEYKADASKEGRVMFLYRKEKKLNWHVIPSQATAGKEKSSLQVLNLCDDAVALTVGEGQRLEITKDMVLAPLELEKNQASAALEGQKKQSISAEEATAFIAVIYPTADGPRLSLVADR